MVACVKQKKTFLPMEKDVCKTILNTTHNKQYTYINDY